MRVFEIVPGLYQSPTPTSPKDVHLRDQDGTSVKVTAVIDLEGTVDPNVPQKRIGDVYVYWPLLDEEDRLPNETALRGLASYVSALMDAGHNVLVHCHSGMNRASLVTGCTLVTRGISPEEAIETLERRRAPEVLSNTTFREWLLKEAAAEG
jgi:protein-tyrosine phosphatase